MIVDGSYRELKATTQAFLGLTENQYEGLKCGELASVFVVNGEEVTEYTQKQLIALEPKPEITYYFYRSQIPDGKPAASGRKQKLTELLASGCYR